SISFQDIEKSFDPAIGVLVDDVYIGTNTTQLQNNFDLESIEILRGPQGTLFGKNTMGGAIRLNRTKPTGEYGLKGQVTVGRYARHDWRVVGNAPIVEDKVAMKAWFFSQNDDGFYWNPTKGKRVGDEDYITGGASFLINPIDDLELLLTYEHIRDRSDSGPLLNLSQPLGSPDVLGGDLLCTVFLQCDVGSEERTSTQNFSRDSELNLNGVSLRADYDVDFGTFTSITAWRHHNELVNQDFDATALDFFSTIRDQEYTQISEEARFAGAFDDLLGIDMLDMEIVAGIYFWYANYELDQQTLFLAPILGSPPGSFTLQATEQDTFSVAPFFQADLNLTDWLRFTAGLRYTYERKSIDFQLATFVGGTGLVPGESFDEEEDWDEVTPRIGFDIKPTDNILTYFSWARGFKSGGFNGRAAAATSVGPYDPEIVDAFELGMKSDWWDRRVRFNLTLFWNEYDDKQEEIVRPAMNAFGQETIVANASEARTRGVELELTVIPIEGLTVRQSLGILDADFVDGSADLTGDLVPDDFEDFKLRRAPKYQYAIYGEYVRDVGPGTAILNLNWRWIDDYETTAQNFRFGQVDDVGLLDGGIAYEYTDAMSREWRAAVFGRNLTDEAYIASALGVAGLFSFGAVNPPRTWGIALGVKF
ncbi:MAG: TonB-dependent receptor, partial [Proteobacteria bacterium]|nr:TonB-dependent receptor [Pseudomonadota bacterium]